MTSARRGEREQAEAAEQVHGLMAAVDAQAAEQVSPAPLIQAPDVPS